MNFTTRILPAAEWSSLAETTLADSWPQLDPAKHHVLVVEQDGVVCGCLALLQSVHAEFLWIAPAHRGKASVGRRLRGAMLDLVRRWGFPTVLMASMDARMRGIVLGLGAIQLPGDHYVLKVKESV